MRAPRNSLVSVVAVAPVIRMFLVAALLGALAALLAPGRAAGAVYVITTLAEDNLANGNCTLREALLTAATDSTHDQCIGDVGPDTIVLAIPGTYELDDGTVSSATRQLTVRGAAGQPASAYVVDMGEANRFLSVGFDSDLTLENLTLTRGLGGTHGGALLVENSSLTLRGVTIAQSRAGNGGGLSFRTNVDHHLEIVGSTFEGNGAGGGQVHGGGVDADFQGAGSARILASRFVDNWIDSMSGSFARKGAGLSLRSFGGGAVELRHLDFVGNVIAAPSFAAGAGAALHVNSTADFLFEDARFLGNGYQVTGVSSGPAALELQVNTPAATVRRLRLLDNSAGTGNDQAVLHATNETEMVVSDVLVGNGGGTGLFLATAGGASLTAGNLTVAGHPGSGLRLSESGGTLRVESSILFGNGTVTGTNVQLFSGTPEVAGDNLVGIDPLFVAAAAGDFRLGAGSIAADAAAPVLSAVGPFDAAHGPRILGPGLDLGALERGALFADDFERGDLLAWGP